MSYFFLINYIVVFVCLVYATITDIKKREVPNYISLGLLIYGTIFNSIYLLAFKGYLAITYFLLFDALVFLICYVFWKLGIFAGGDAKLFSGIAATIPVFEKSLLFDINTKFPFVLSLFILSLLLMFPIISVKAFWLYFKRVEIKKKIKEGFKTTIPAFLFNILYVVSLYFVFSFFSLPFWFFLIISIALGFVSKKIRYPISTAIFVISLIISPKHTIFTMLGAIITALLFAIMIYLFVLSRSGLFNYKKKIKDLKEGDLLAYNLVMQDKSLVPLKLDFFGDFKLAFKQSLKEGPRPIFELVEKRKHLYKEVVISNNLASGLTNEEIRRIKRLYFNKEIELKETTPLVPSILIAYVILCVFGDVVWLVFSTI